MIYLAAMTEGELTQRDFLRYVAADPVHSKVEFNGGIELAGCRVPEGYMNRYIWRMRDERITSNDISVVVIFNQTGETRDFEEHQFMHAQREHEIEEFLGWLTKMTNAKQIESALTTDGNMVYYLRDCDTRILSEAFSKHSRPQIRKV